MEPDLIRLKLHKTAFAVLQAESLIRIIESEGLPRRPAPLHRLDTVGSEGSG